MQAQTRRGRTFYGVRVTTQVGPSLARPEPRKQKQTTTNKGTQIWQVLQRRSRVDDDCTGAALTSSEMGLFV